jgi:amino acid transporter
VAAHRNNEKGIGYLEAVSIGVGGMVGGGIFAVLGLAVTLARGGTPVAFAVAGIIALLTAYSYAKLSVAFPNEGGTVTFLNNALGRGVLVGGMNILLWLSYTTMLSLYAYAFGHFGATFFHNSPFWAHLLISSVIIAIGILNTFSARVVGEAEDWIVAIKVAILIVFVALGSFTVHISRMKPATWSPPLSLVAGGMVIFLAYEGFELIANAAEDIRNPFRDLPRAFYTAVIFVSLLYISVAIVTVGDLPLDKVVQARDYALAAAARPFMGSFGFKLISVAAMFSTASAINATLYGSERFSFVIAEAGELPSSLDKNVFGKPLIGLIVTVVITLLISNLFDLSSISTMGSSGFLLIFAMVNGANVRLSKKTHSIWWISALGMVACIGALIALLWETHLMWPGQIWVLVAMLALAMGVEATYRYFPADAFRGK